MSKVVIATYKRCSTDNQELSLQDDIINKEIDRIKEDNKNIKDIEYEILEFKDFAVSGKSLDRPDFKRLMELIDKKKINILIVTKLDRLARSLQDLLNITSKLDTNGIKFIVIEQKIDTSTASGRLLFQIVGAFSEFERVIIRERMESGRKKAELTGTRSGKPCHRPKVDIDIDGVKYKYAQGMSMNKISKLYNVSITPIRRILKN